jgi:hypothetical protein
VFEASDRAALFWQGLAAAVQAKYGHRALSDTETGQGLRSLLSITAVFVRLLQVGVSTALGTALCKCVPLRVLWMPRVCAGGRLGSGHMRSFVCVYVCFCSRCPLDEFGA